MSKYLFIASLLLAILFIESVFSIAHEKVRTRELARYQESVNIVEMKQAEAEAALIYGDQEKAGSALRQAKVVLQKIASTPLSAVKDKSALQELSASIELLSQKVFRITTVENPEGLLDLASFSEVQTPLAIGGLMGPYQKKFYAFNTSFAAVYLIDLNARTVTISSPDEIPGLERFTKAAMDEGGMLFLTSPSRIARFNPLNSSVEILTTNLPLADIADIAVFGKRLYSLNRVTGSIMRHDIANTEVRQGTPWLSQDIALAGATSLAIDGSVYVADAQGMIRKFTRGKEDAFTLPTLEPPLRAPSRLTANGTHVIVIEPTERRIIVLDQSGALIQQVISPAFDRLIDAVYDAASRNFYVLNGTRIYAVPFTF